MRTALKFVASLIFLFIAESAFAQYPYGYGYGSSPGLDRSIGRVPKAARAKDKDKKEVDMVEVTVNYLEKKLNLDDFQKAAITKVYNQYKPDVMLIGATDEPIAVKKDKMRELTEEIDKKVMAYLSDKQVEEYKKMIAERKD